MEENASAYAENGYNDAILEKKVQNSLSVIVCNHEKRKDCQREWTQQSIKKQKYPKPSGIMEENARAYAENGHNGAILEKKVQNSSQLRIDVKNKM